MSTIRMVPLVAALLSGTTLICLTRDADAACTTTYYLDYDKDGYGTPTSTKVACSVPAGYVTNNRDCNDRNAAIKPGAAERCDGVDNNCAGGIDEGVKLTYWRDADADTFGNPALSTQACSAPSGYVVDYRDCDDAVAAVHPGATETCDAVDNDCDSQIDEGLTFATYYRDEDVDTFGTATTTKSACSKPSGYVTNSLDCNDKNSAIKPGATEVCAAVDNDCDAQIDEGLTFVTYYRDEDVDTFGTSTTAKSACSKPSGYVTNSLDCNDKSSAIKPTATEVCDAVDNNCDGKIDEGVLKTFYRDEDVDTYGAASTTASACSAPSGYVTNSLDCNDKSSAIKPSATEVCDAVDNDCDGQIDEGLSLTTYYRDADADSYGLASATQSACRAATGYVTRAGDCNDTNAAIKPGANEVCDPVDNDCDGQIDEGVTKAYYPDGDGDGYGTGTTPVVACTAPAGHATGAGDCNDQNAASHPYATELCNGINDDCDAWTDESVMTTYYRDADGDTFGTSGDQKGACSAPAGYVSNHSDCDDTQRTIHPGAPELCDGIDNDCDTTVDDGAKLTFYADVDGDGFGKTTTQACTPPVGYVAVGGDCDDSKSDVHPGALETCDNRDEDCDGTIDDTSLTYYRDADADGYGDASQATAVSCSGATPAGHVITAGDCDDLSAAVHPLVVEQKDGIDNDCDGVVDGVDINGDGAADCVAGDPGCTDLCHVIGHCGGRDIVVCDLLNPNTTGQNMDFAHLTDTCAARGAAPVTIMSEDDDACIAGALERVSPLLYFYIGFNRVETTDWVWEGGESAFVGLVLISGDNYYERWDATEEDAVNSVMSVNVELHQGSQRPFLAWTGHPNSTELQRVVCEH